MVLLVSSKNLLQDVSNLRTNMNFALFSAVKTETSKQDINVCVILTSHWDVSNCNIEEPAACE